MGDVLETPLRTTLADAVEFLATRNISYALVEGLAVSLRGRPRVTVDVDMVIGCDVPKALELLNFVEHSVFSPLFPDANEVVEQAMILPLRHRTSGVKLDLTIGLSGFERQVIERASLVDLAGLSVFVASAEDLLIMKVLAGRTQDEQDMRGLVLAHGEDLDWTYCLDVVKQLQEALGLDLVQRMVDMRGDSRRD